MQKQSASSLKRMVRLGLFCLSLLLCSVFPAIALTGCKIIKTDSDKVKELDFTVVDDQDLPKELKKLIEERKDNTVRLTYTTKDYTYIVAGYGTQKTSGYSIRVDDVYLTSTTIVADFDLIGPAADEAVTELPTTPYIVIKIEKRDETVEIEM